MTMMNSKNNCQTQKNIFCKYQSSWLGSAELSAQISSIFWRRVRTSLLREPCPLLRFAWRSIRRNKRTVKVVYLPWRCWEVHYLNRFTPNMKIILPASLVNFPTLIIKAFLDLADTSFSNLNPVM